MSRRCSNSKQGTQGVVEVDEEETHLSGAYIRSLVKHLTSSRTKEHENNSLDAEILPTSGNIGDGLSDEARPSPPPEQPQQHKKQVRRRLHTSRPYQERLLNMAEARREIVTALKFHRAAMKQATEQQQQQQQQQQAPVDQQPLQPSPPFAPETEGKQKSRRNPRIYASNDNLNFPSYQESFSYSGFCCPPNQNPYSWPVSSVPPPVNQETLCFQLPNQPLGLNLNLQDFNNLETAAFYGSSNPSIYTSSSSSSYTSSPPLSMPTEELPFTGISQGPAVMNTGDSGLHQVMDDKEMAEIRSIGEQHQMEWNDTLNLVTSAWWFKFIRSTEIGHEEKLEDYGSYPFDEIMEFPSWLNANDSCLQQQFSDYHSDECFQDAALPCMEIEEIDRMDGDWLA